MPRVRLTHADIVAIKAARDTIPISDIAERYKIGFNRIYKIWKSNAPEFSIDENITSVDRILDSEINSEIERFIDSGGDVSACDSACDSIADKQTILQLRAQLTNLTNMNALLQR